MLNDELFLTGKIVNFTDPLPAMCHDSMHHPVWGSRPVERKPQKRQINAKLCDPKLRSFLME